MAKEKLSGIYAIVNLVNGKQYVGSAVDLDNRKSVHFSKLKNNQHVNGKLQNAWNKYGERNFYFTVLELVPNKESLVEVEQYWIDASDCVDNGYNLRAVARSNLGMKFSEEGRFNVRKALLGRKHTEETRKKIGEGNKGKVVSEEVRKKMSEVRKNSEICKEHLKRISQAKIGTKHSPETIEKMKLAQVGRTHLKEVRKKISEANKGRVVSEETRRKISEAKRARDAAKKLALENNDRNEERTCQNPTPTKTII